MANQETKRIEKSAEKPAAPEAAAPELEDLQSFDQPASLRQVALSFAASQDDPTDNQSAFWRMPG
jgi:hypothetical protein